MSASREGRPRPRLLRQVERGHIELGGGFISLLDNEAGNWHLYRHDGRLAVPSAGMTD